MTYFSNLEKKINNEQRKTKKINNKVIAIILTVVATIGYFSLFTNLVGFLKHFLLGTFGIFAYALFTALYVISGLILKGKKYHITTKYLLALIFSLLSVLAIFHMAFSGGVDFSTYGEYLGSIYNMQVSVGGLLLGLLIYPLQKFLNFGAYILFLIVLVVCVTIIYNGIADAKSMSKIDFKFFKKKNKANATSSEPVKNQNTIKIDTEENIEEFNKGIVNESVGLGAEVKKEETSRDIARRKLGLDRLYEDKVNVNSNDDQLDTFKKNYMNTGGSVFSTKNFDRQDYSNTNYSGTFGYSTVLENGNKRRNSAEEEQKYNEYRKFMGLAPVATNVQEPKTETNYENHSNIFQTSDIFDTYSSSKDFYDKHESTESSDEKLFGTPKTEDTNIKFTYSSPAEKSGFMDKLTSDNNEEVKPENLNETEVKEENDLRAIFEKPVPKNDIELPKSLQNENYNFTRKFDTTSKNPIDYEIKNIQNYTKTPEESQTAVDLPRQKLPKYNYTKPTLDLLNTASTDPSMYGGNVEETSHKIESVLEEFKIPAKVIGITRGPAVTRYELEMPVGISVNKIPTLESDIAMRIATSKKIMIQAPIPGMSAFGIEVPNDKVATVSLKETLSSEAFILSKSPCSFALGKELNGVTDICAVNKMPHVLIAGSTGSGKSVCLNSLILSILYKSSPEDVKFILIDPKRVEFSIYAGLPHLVMPDIISEPKKADNALAWAVREMEKRYDALAEHRVRNIEEYNNLQDVKDRYLPKMPYIIIIMDEFADIMQSPDCKDIESKVIRLAAKARAAGIHLVLATQRPSVDVLSGTAKNNFPARIAFFLTTQTDSRTILGYGGAENLLGRGDMLYVAPGSNEGAKRLQGCYVSDEEVKTVVEFVISHNAPDFDPSIEAAINKTHNVGDSVNPDGTFASYDNDGMDEEAEMQSYAKNVMKEFIRVGRASATYIQRTQRVGFAKAGRIMDYLERKKYIAPSDGTAKARAVYMTKQQYVEIFGDTDFDDHD